MASDTHPNGIKEWARVGLRYLERYVEGATIGGVIGGAVGVGIDIAMLTPGAFTPMMAASGAQIGQTVGIVVGFLEGCGGGDMFPAYTKHFLKARSAEKVTDRGMNKGLAPEKVKDFDEVELDQVRNQWRSGRETYALDAAVPGREAGPASNLIKAKDRSA